MSYSELSLCQVTKMRIETTPPVSLEHAKQLSEFEQIMLKVEKASKLASFRLRSLIKRTFRAFARSRVNERLFLLFKTLKSVVKLQIER